MGFSGLLGGGGEQGVCIPTQNTSQIYRASSRMPKKITNYAEIREHITRKIWSITR